MARRILAILFAVSVGGCGSWQKVTLKQSYLPGAYEVTLRQVTYGQWRPSVAAKQREDDVFLTMVMDLTVQPPDAAGTKKAELTFRQIRTKAFADGRLTAEFDSGNPAGQTASLTAVYSPFLSAKIRFEIPEAGKIQSFTGLEEIAPRSEQQRKQYRDWLVEGVLSRGAKAFPGHPTGFWDTWTIETSMPFGKAGDLKVTEDCTLLSVKKTPAGTVATVEVIATAGIDMPLDRMKAVHSGQMTVNVDTGLIVQQVWDGAIDMGSTQQDSAGQTTQATSRQKVRTEITMAMKKESPAKPSGKP